MMWYESVLSHRLIIPVLRMVGRALTSDEAGRSMEALELYNNALSTIRSGLAVLHSSVGALPAADAVLHELREKMEKYVYTVG